MDPQTEYVVLVDSEDQVVGQEEKLSAHQQGLLHRAFSIFLFRKRNDRFELLLQRRDLNKYHAGGLWSNTCCSHPRLNEGIIEAASRRLFEEMGIKAELHLVDRFQYRAEFENGLVEHELDYLLLAWDEERPFVVNPAEVMEVRWIELEQLQRELAQKPEQFTPWFKEALGLVKKYL